MPPPQRSRGPHKSLLCDLSQHFWLLNNPNNQATMPYILKDTFILKDSHDFSLLLCESKEIGIFSPLFSTCT